MKLYKKARKAAGISCGSCIYHESCGSCMRREPETVATGSNRTADTVWPQTPRREWCGNWKTYRDGHYVTYSEALLEALRWLAKKGTEEEGEEENES